MKIDKIITLVLILIIFGWFLGYLILWDGIIQEEIQHYKARDEFCREMGFNESADYLHSNCRYGEDYRIECDDDRIFYTIAVHWCIEYDKWQRCGEKSPTYYLYKGNVTC